MKHSTLKTTVSAAFLAAVFVAVFSAPALAAETSTYSGCWALDADGSWIAKDKNTNMITDAWFCDDAVTANGKNVWYLLNKDGKMVTAGLVQDATGNFYSLETDHNGYFGMLRYQSGTYDGIYLELEKDHNGSFAAIKNQSGIDKLKEKYGLVTVTIGNGNIVYSSNEVRTSATTDGWHTYANGTKYYYENDERVKGWKQIDGKYYYFNKSNGAMLVKTYTPDGYYVDADGVWDGRAVNKNKITEKTTVKTTTQSASGSKSTVTTTTTTDERDGQTVTVVTKSGSTSGSSSDSTKTSEKAVTEPGGNTTQYEDRGSQTPEWDAAAVSQLKSYVNNAKTKLNEAQSLYDAGKALSAGREKMKKYSQATGKACGAIDIFVSLDVLLEERPELKTSDGSNVAKLSEKSQELLEDVGNLYIDDETDLDSPEVKREMEKIQTVLTYLGKIEALANTM